MGPHQRLAARPAISPRSGVPLELFPRLRAASEAKVGLVLGRHRRLEFVVVDPESGERPSGVFVAKAKKFEDAHVKASRHPLQGAEGGIALAMRDRIEGAFGDAGLRGDRL